MSSRRALLAAGLVACGGLARAQQRWPSRPVHLVLAYPPGGVSDVVARELAQDLSQRLGEPVLIEHRPGVGGSLAMNHVARAAPDGHTLCFSAITALTLLPQAGSVPFDPRKDIVPVVSIMLTPALVVGTSKVRGATLAEVIAWAGRQGHALRWATTGVGTTGHLILEQVRQASGADIVHVPYKGGGQPLSDALAGHFDVLSSNVGPLQLEYVQAGKLSALAVGAPGRVAVLPKVPTLAEQGYERANRGSVFGVFAPGGTPVELVERINAEFNRSLAASGVKAQLEAVSNVPTGGSAAEFAAQIEQERAVR
ncbi:Bug family tripartite tricarboxylate transporter substrate binding protein [Piscinibacter terrae]|uniref:Tripartite tricarboxylate transporter substrate binding protein n=1 Tax=Piscinibacter terrae TaxID=2496871 RepID=A0A3N7HSE1_9BURK|nr:tripartite tricarboxylate transporter substrate binding protein [Albitalea terrae]RQP25190.1 tripartite tricarboxylate transporter substrate binding protein [Albitalea terrae]